MMSEKIKLDHYSPYFLLKVDGKALEKQGNSISLEITENLNTPSILSFTIDTSFKNHLHDLKEFYDILDNIKEGKIVEGYIGYFNDSDKLKKPYFSGKIVGISPNFSASGLPSLTVESYDNLHFLKKKMPITASERKIYLEESYDEIIKKIMKRNNLEEGKIDSAPFKKDSETQKTEVSDYDLLNSLANRLGYEFFIRDEKFYFRKPGDLKDKKGISAPATPPGVSFQ